MRGIGNFVELFWREGKVSRIPSSLYSNFTDSSINSPSFSALLLIILLLCLLVWFVVCENTSIGIRALHDGTPEECVGD